MDEHELAERLYREFVECVKARDARDGRLRTLMIRPAVGYIAAAVLAAVTRTGCGAKPNEPAPVPSPSPSPIFGVPNATAFENLDLVRRLEAATGRQTKLVAVVGIGLSLDGRLRPGTSWEYRFSYRPGSQLLIAVWEVLTSGVVRPRDPLPPLGSFDDTELGPYLKVDSPEAIRIALSHGVQAMVDKRPSTTVLSAGCAWLGRQPTWVIRFNDLSPGAPTCEPRVWLNAETGALLDRDIGCIARLP